MHKALLLATVASILPVVPASAQSLTSFFSTANLAPLAQSPMLLDLIAQDSHKVARADVNAFDDYFLINGPGKLRVNFDRQLQNKGQSVLPGWFGVAQYANQEISYDLQDGFRKVKANYNMPAARAGHVAVYKTINTGELVYDYAVQKTSTQCREYLFTPATGGFQTGFSVNCFQTLRIGRARMSAGRPDRN